MLEFIIVSTLTIFFTILNSLKPISAWLARPPNTYFLGLSHTPSDYFYYLTQFNQGASGYWGPAPNLMNPEYPQTVWVGWINVFLGRIWSLSGLDPVGALHLTVILSCISFFIISYIFIKIFYGNKQKYPVSLMTFFIFLSANTLPYFSRTSNGFEVSDVKFWFNRGNPFVRISTVPHHLIGYSLILLIILITVIWQKIKNQKLKILFLIISAVSGFTLASINTVEYAFTVCVLGLAVVWEGIAKKSFRFIFLVSFPLVTFFISGLPMALYMKDLTSRLPFSLMKDWETSYQLVISFQDFAKGYGPVLILGLLGMIFGARKLNLAGKIAWIYSALGLMFFFSPIPTKLGLNNTRFLPTVINLFLSCFAALLISRLVMSGKLVRFVSPIIIIFLFLWTACTLPSYIPQIREKLDNKPNDAFLYLPEAVNELFGDIRSVTKPSDIALVTWPYHLSYTALTLRPLFTGDPVTTIDNSRKNELSGRFFEGKMTPDEAESFVNNYHISWLVDNDWNGLDVVYPDLVEKVKTRGYISLYRIK